MGSTPVPNPSPPSFLELSLSKKGDSDLAYEGFQSHVPTTEDGRDEKTKVYGRIIPSRPLESMSNRSTDGRHVGLPADRECRCQIGPFRKLETTGTYRCLIFSKSDEIQ